MTVGVSLLRIGGEILAKEVDPNHLSKVSRVDIHLHLTESSLELQ